MLQVGPHLEQAVVADMRIVACHWVTKTTKPYIILRLDSMKCKKLLDSRKRQIDKNYMPHGQKIFIRDDLTKEQGNVAKETRDIAMKLREKGYFVYANLDKLRIGQPPSQVWIHYQDPRIQTMLELPRPISREQPQTDQQRV